MPEIEDMTFRVYLRKGELCCIYDRDPNDHHGKLVDSERLSQFYSDGLKSLVEEVFRFGIVTTESRDQVTSLRVLKSLQDFFATSQEYPSAIEMLVLMAFRSGVEYQKRKK